MKTIYRIEHPDTQTGVYSAKDNNKVLIFSKHSQYRELFNNHCNYPNIFKDLDLWSKWEDFDEWWDFFCACSSLDNLYAWFPINTIPELINLGFRVYELQVSDFRESPYQVVFKKEWILSKTDISDKFNFQTLKQND